MVRQAEAGEEGREKNECLMGHFTPTQSGVLMLDTLHLAAPPRDTHRHRHTPPPHRLLPLQQGTMAQGLTTGATVPSRAPSSGQGQP